MDYFKKGDCVQCIINKSSKGIISDFEKVGDLIYFYLDSKDVPETYCSIYYKKLNKKQCTIYQFCQKMLLNLKNKLKK